MLFIDKCLNLSLIWFYIKGKVEIKFDILTEEEANENPVGLGREAPEPLDPPKYNNSNLCKDYKEMNLF